MDQLKCSSGVWLSPDARRALRTPSLAPAQSALAGVGLPLDPRPLVESLRGLRVGGELPRALRPLLQARGTPTQSPAFFLTELEELPEGWRGQVLVDAAYRAPLLLLRGPAGAWALINPKGRGEAPDLASFLRLRSGVCWGASK